MAPFCKLIYQTTLVYIQGGPKNGTKLITP